jgi:hypothetical protein
MDVHRAPPVISGGARNVPKLYTAPEAKLMIPNPAKAAKELD